MQQIGPTWLKPGLDQRFIEAAKQAGRLNEVVQLQHKQRQLDQILKTNLADEQYELILELQDVRNILSSIEKEWLYFAGLKDGIQLVKETNSSM